MKKTEMLKKNYEFKKVLSKGKFFSKEKIEIVILKNNKKDINFLGIAVSSKNGKAFQRNRAKRLIREAYYSLENKLFCGYSIVILLRKNLDIKDLKYKDVFNELKGLFYDAKIIKKEDVI